MNESATYEIRLKDRFSSPLSGLETKMDRFEGKVGGLKSSFLGLGDTIAGAFAGGFIASSAASLLTTLKDVTVGAVDAAAKFTSLREAIEFASGREASKNIAYLDAEIDRLGLDMNSAYKGFKTFQGALMGTSLEGERGREIFTGVSEAATVMKLSADQTEGAFLALGQMISKGNVQAEELRGQLGERLPGAFGIFARALGVSTQKLNKMLDNGEVLAEKALPLFAAELRKTFAPGLNDAINSYNANLNRFNNYILRAKIFFGNQLLPVINDFISIIPKLDFNPLLHTFRQLKNEVSVLIDLFDEITTSLGATFTTFEKFTIGLRYMSYLFRVAFTPIRVAVHLFTQLISLVKESADVFKGLGNILAGSITKDFSQVARGTTQLMSGLNKIGDRISSNASDFWKEEKEGWKQIFLPLNGAGQMPTASGGWNPFGSMYGTATGGGRSAADSKTSTAGVEKISSGTRNITVHINKLVETVKFEKTNGQSESQLIEMIKRALITGVNDVNIVAQ
jgi:tape measure domain-containing protein